VYERQTSRQATGSPFKDVMCNLIPYCADYHIANREMTPSIDLLSGAY